ncbi:MAG: EAL domain-containing protein [Solirubrobacteraceae bacterium]|nr:EAL domain-containing protein [Solirubrobacteraceae bacterium]
MRHTEAPPAVDPTQRLFDLSRDMLGTASLDGYFTWLNPAWTRTLGWSNDQLMAQSYASFVHPDDLDATALETARLAAVSGYKTAGFENRYRAIDGSYRTLLWNTISADDTVYFAAKDVTDIRAAETDSAHAASVMKGIVDSVTDGIFVANADGELTFINPAGLTLLGYRSELELLGRSPHAVFHHTHADGREYPHQDCPLSRVRHTGEAVLVEDDTFWRQDGSALEVSCSSSPIDLDGGTGSVVAFRDITARKANDRRVRRELEALSWVGRIRDALDEKRLVLFAQPIVDIATGETVYHELLVRMRSLTDESIPPGMFLPVAEQYGLITAIDRYVIKLALTYAAAGHHIAINLSADSISDASLFDYVKDQLASSRVDPRLVVFEITETALIDNEAVAQHFISRIRGLHSAVALDDFGTGYGSFRYLKHLPVSALKIDREFVGDLAEKSSTMNRHIVEAVVTLARGVRLKTVAEGVEDEQTLEQLRALGVDFAQGYLFARPAPADEVFRLMRKDQ